MILTLTPVRWLRILLAENRNEKAYTIYTLGPSSYFVTLRPTGL